ncbi:hypothetical protein D4R52_01035 [bacterium]|nr:MAG: hypothetical protein D4R52_01035 [bacterium]
MYLKKLEIHGFKSFAKKTVLEFQPGIVSIVGPNGSGKSNLADCLRWVFGEQSMKLLRGKKSEDVIFAGSDSKARLGGAEVSVSFDNSNHVMPLDYDEVVVTRRLYRDQGASEYLVNGAAVRLLDIQELLSKSGFGNTSYHVIGQGLIDQLILGGPAAIKELIEEASGVKPYYVKRERTLRRLDHTEANLSQVSVLLKEIEPRLRSLRRQIKKMEHRTEVEQELRTAQVLHYGQILNTLGAQIGEVDSKLGIFTKQTDDLNQEIKKLSSDIGTQENETLGHNNNYKKVQIDLEALHKKKFTLQEDFVALRGKLKDVAASQAEMQVDISAVRTKFREALKRLRGLFSNFRKEEAAEVEKLFGEISQLIDPEDARKSQAEEANKSLREREERLNRELTELLGKIQALEADLVKYREQEQDIKQQLFVKERLVRNKQDTLVKTAEQKNVLAVDQARFLTRRESYLEEVKAELGADYKKLLEAHAGEMAPIGTLEKIANLKKQMSMIGGVDDMTLAEYKETEERFQYLTAQSADLNKGVADLKIVIEELDVVIKKEFQDAFAKISTKFAEYFRTLFNGGRATMTILHEKLVEEGEPGTEEGEVLAEEEEKTLAEKLSKRTEVAGIDIRATPPGKKLAGISALSGGERALTSIAFLCAMLATYPSPFVVLDEVDAALDEANSIRFGQILGTIASKTQFITITHNRETMRQSHTLYGVTMGEDSVSRVLSLKLEQAAAFSSKN